MAMDLSSLGILVKDEQGNLQEQKLGEVLALGGSNSPQPSLTLREGDIVPPLRVRGGSEGLRNFRQQLSKVTGETGYSLPSRQPTTNNQQPTNVILERSDRIQKKEVDSIGLKASRMTTSQPNPESRIPNRPHLTGPVQEIGSLSLDDLQHWNSKEQIVKHLTDEIGLLAKDSLAVRANGIRAWQKSPLHQLYLEIGRQSMVEDKPLGQVVEERTRAGKPTLTLEQFEALLEANEQMRY